MTSPDAVPALRVGPPGGAFFDPGWFERDLEAIFIPHWQFAGHADAQPEPGSYFTACRASSLSAPSRRSSSTGGSSPRTPVEGRDYDRASLMELLSVTSRQDIRLCERVQRGLRMPTYAPGPLNLEHQAPIASFYDWYEKAVSRDDA